MRKGFTENMTNSSLLRCAAAFLVLSAYIWLFGITGVIEGDAPVAYADEGLETPRSEPEDSDEDEGFLSGTNLNINPVNDPKPTFADLPGNDSPALQEDYTAYADTIPFVPDSAEAEPAPIPVTTTTIPPPAATTPEPSPPAGDTDSGVTPPEVISAPEVTAALPPEGGIDIGVTPAETVVNPALAGRLTVQTSNGQVTDTALNIVSRIVQHEIGSSFHDEAIKAQAVAAYTYIMHYQSQGGVANAELASAASDKITGIVREVLGQAIYHEGSYIASVYYASSAGYTSSSANVWGGDIPYLRSVQTAFDKEHDPNYGLVAAFTPTDIRVAVLERTGINLTGDPAAWLRIINHVDTVYVGDMTVGGHTSFTRPDGREIPFTGRHFRDVMGTQKLRSAAFEFTYDSDTDRFTFTTYGYGHGVGLSQNGANILARHYGYDYKQILAFYYPGTTIQ
ncbi:MAG: SpoIID/LytB domain-containing protein [Oscillospiraceae bacterium]|nr:SpoIID/LytB domain-containing protein [Oscillospiraceae bacterium]